MGVTYSLASAAVMVALCAAARVQVDEVGIGFGPKVASWERGGMKVVLHALPLNSYLQLPGLNPFEEDTPEPPDGKRLITDAPRAVQVLVPLAPWLALAAAAMALLGPGLALHHTRTGLAQILLGAWSPFDTGGPLIGRWAQVVEAGDLPTAAGILLAKSLAAATLPLGGAPLVRAAANLVGLMRSKATAHALTLAVVAGIAVFGAWLVGIVAYVAST